MIELILFAVACLLVSGIAFIGGYVLGYRFAVLDIQHVHRFYGMQFYTRDELADAIATSRAMEDTPPETYYERDWGNG